MEDDGWHVIIPVTDRKTVRTVVQYMFYKYYCTTTLCALAVLPPPPAFANILGLLLRKADPLESVSDWNLIRWMACKIRRQKNKLKTHIKRIY